MEPLSILVISCDKYADVWPIFFRLFFKYWPDCPFKIYLSSNLKEYEDPRIQSIKVGKDISWGSNLQVALSKITSKYVLTFLEDFLIFKPIDTNKIKRQFENIQQLDGHYLRLRDNPKPDKSLESTSEIGEISPGQNWRVAMQPAIWKHSSLVGLLRPDETAWDMEINGSIRSNEMITGFYSTYDCLIFFNNGIEGSNWLRYNLPYLKKEGIVLPVSQFPVMTRRKHILRFISNKLNHLLVNPAKLTVKKYFPKVFLKLKNAKTSSSPNMNLK
jgi:hypothetical protein